MKNVIIKFILLGISFAFTFALLIGIGYWYISRPKSPIPWDSKAITAEYIKLSTTENHPLFFYVFQNNTDADYELDKSQASLFFKLRKENAIVLSNDDYIYPVYPIIIPAHRRGFIRFHIYFEMPQELQDKLKDAKDSTYQKLIGNYLNDRGWNVNGFVFYDKQNHYEIDLPKGW
jgi:hypothetical protein